MGGGDQICSHRVLTFGFSSMDTRSFDEKSAILGLEEVIEFEITEFHTRLKSQFRARMYRDVGIVRYHNAGGGGGGNRLVTNLQSKRSILLANYLIRLFPCVSVHMPRSHAIDNHCNPLQSYTHLEYYQTRLSCCVYD
jgi:hypothetical protein